MSNSDLDSMRNLAGDLSRKLKKNKVSNKDKERLSASPPIKEKISEISNSTPQITGVKNKKTNGIEGGKAKAKNTITGSGEAGSNTPGA